jgi:uncharacterized protein YyaL (SSP411 family)
LLAGPAEIAIVGAPTDDATMTDLERAAWMSTSPGAVVAVGRGGGDPPWAPLLEGRSAIDGLPTAYVCRQFVCLRPVTTVADLTVALSG